ncbi:MAG: hypothetical protein ACOC58_01455 [Chloroflexota bacterium]
MVAEIRGKISEPGAKRLYHTDTPVIPCQPAGRGGAAGPDRHRVTMWTVQSAACEHDG